MKPIQMVDLVGQYQRIKDEIRQSFDQILETAAFINGPEVQAFRQELAAFNGVKHVVPCANGTDALQIALMALNLEPGDEVIVPDFTYIATAEVVALLQLKLALCDIEPDTFNMDVDSLRRAITPRTKVIVAVHLFGQCTNMAPVLEVAREHNLVVIEDNAQSIGSSYTFPDGRKVRTGAIGHIGTTSFYPSKNLGAYGDAGAIFTNDDQLGADLATIANHGQNRRYYFDKVGVNSRLDSLQAAILRVKLRRLNEYIAARQKVADYYDAAFAGNPNIRTPFRAPYTEHVFHQYTIRVVGRDRDGLLAHLASKQIPAVVFYPLPVHQQTAYQQPHWRDEDYPNSVLASQEVVSLPMHTELDEEQLAYITAAVLEYLR